MLCKGKKKFSIPKDTNVHIETDSTFTLYKLNEEEERLEIVGPFTERLRRVKFATTEDSRFFIEINKDALWSISENKNTRHEKANPNKVETDIIDEPPLTLKEEMQRYVNQAISENNQLIGEPDLEEENDFDVDDDLDEESLFTPYELRELDEEYILETPEEKQQSEEAAKQPTTEGAEPAPSISSTNETQSSELQPEPQPAKQAS